MKELLIALTLAHAGDTATTAANIAAGVPEGNPLLPRHVYANIAVTTAETIVQIQALRALERRKPRLARTLAIVALVVETTAVGWNLRARADARRR